MRPTLRSLWTGGVLRQEDYQTACKYVFDQREADLIIAPDGRPYLYRWHVTQRNETGNVYLHLQVADDPERPLHDHPWDNMSVLLAGGYDELIQRDPPNGSLRKLPRNKGDVVFRKATEAHRLFLPVDTLYTLTLFTTGPAVQEWGFWIETDGKARWVSHKECVEDLPDGRSVWVGPKS